MTCGEVLIPFLEMMEETLQRERLVLIEEGTV